MSSSLRPRIWLVTDAVYPAARTLAVARAVAAALPAGAFAVQLRAVPAARAAVAAPSDASVASRAVRASGAEGASGAYGAYDGVAAEGIVALGRAIVAAGVPVVVNVAPAVRVAAEVGAVGVHLGIGARGVTARDVRAALGADAFVSAPAHDDEDVGLARASRVDAVFVSPIFASPGKAAPRGVGALARARSLAGDAIAVYALGGVEVRVGCVRSCCEAGADGVAVVRALYTSDDPARDARALHDECPRESPESVARR